MELLVLRRLSGLDKLKRMVQDNQAELVGLINENRNVSDRERVCQAATDQDGLQLLIFVD